tara:strand:+ start:586 stop:840 length:255 start_codon:yes stop_codon:yes gene_type:complete
MSKERLLKCHGICMKKDVSCPNNDCKMWIDYEEDLNCTLIAVHKNGEMTLREVAQREGISFVRVKQIQDKALQKIRKFGLLNSN